MREENLVRGRAFDFDGGIGDLVWERLFFPQTSGDIIFFLTLTTWRCKIFSQHYKPWKIFLFSAKTFSARYFLARIIFSSKSVCRIFFPEITHTPPPRLKSQTVGPLRRNVHPPVHPFHFQVRHFLILIQQQEVLVLYSTICNGWFWKISCRKVCLSYVCSYRKNQYPG